MIVKHPNMYFICNIIRNKCLKIRIRQSKEKHKYMPKERQTDACRKTEKYMTKERQTNTCRKKDRQIHAERQRNT